MLNRSIERDYDVAYYKRAIQKCLDDIRDFSEGLAAVDYDPYEELKDAEDQIACMREEFSLI